MWLNDVLDIISVGLSIIILFHKLQIVFATNLTIWFKQVIKRTINVFLFRLIAMTIQDVQLNCFLRYSISA